MICYVYVLYTRTDLERDSDTWTSLDPSAAKTFGTHERLTHVPSVIFFVTRLVHPKIYVAFVFGEITLTKYILKNIDIYGI